MAIRNDLGPEGAKHVAVPRQIRGFLVGSAWRIIPFSKWLGSPPFISHEVWPFVREQPQLGDVLTMVINHLLSGMILQVSQESNLMGI